MAYAVMELSAKVVAADESDSTSTGTDTGSGESESDSGVIISFESETD